MHSLPGHPPGCPCVHELLFLVSCPTSEWWSPHVHLHVLGSPHELCSGNRPTGSLPPGRTCSASTSGRLSPGAVPCSVHPCFTLLQDSGWTAESRVAGMCLGARLWRGGHGHADCVLQVEREGAQRLHGRRHRPLLYHRYSPTGLLPRPWATAGGAGVPADLRPPSCLWKSGLHRGLGAPDRAGLARPV